METTMIRRAFTLIELLVVVAIIGVLVAVLIPAVQAARESARNTQCTNNIKQIGLAVLQYHDANSHLPPGNYAKRAGVCVGAIITPEDTDDAANWAIYILPFLELQPLYHRYDLRLYNEAPENQEAREAIVSTYVCPNDDVAELSVPGFGPALALNVAYRPGSYRAVSGRSDGRQFLDDPNVTQYPMEWRGAMHIIGILGLTTEKLKDIADGTSNTLLAGESVFQTKPEFRTFWAYSHSFFSLSSTVPQERTFLGDYEQCRTIGGTGMAKPCARQWGGSHPAAVNFVAGDGSARTLSLDIDTELFAAMGSIAGSD
jgi:prepilin-type N-terminal cleavage/methylation domain-containing protein